MAPEPDSPRAGELSWRLDAAERKLSEIDKRTEDLPVVKEQLRNLVEELDAIKRVLWTIAGGLVLLVISVLFAAAQFGGGA